MRRVMLSAGCLAVLGQFGCSREAEPQRGEWEVPAEVVGVPNLDDDDGSGQPDWEDDGADEDNDLASLSLDPQVLLPTDRVRFTLTGEDLRVWGNGVVQLDADTPSRTLGRDTLPPLSVEFGAYGARGALRVEVVDPQDKVIFDQEVALWGAPLLLNHHLQPGERYFVVEDPGWNTEMVEDLRRELGDALEVRPSAVYEFDVWVQDEFEMGVLVGPESRIDVVIDSIRSEGYGLDPFPERVVAQGEDFLVDTWGRGYPTSQDSFGNLEVSPPVTVDGVDYPFGRIYHGVWDYGDGLHPALDGFLAEQRVQDPFVLDVSWLCVGHVDEFTTFLPDATSPLGFRLFVADTRLGLELVDGLDPELRLPRYESGHRYATAGALQQDQALRALNEDYQRDFIEPNVATMLRELGLTEADVVRVPALFEELPACGPYGLALIPATVNLLAATGSDGRVKAFLPDPFLRTDEADQASDPFIQAVNALLPAEVDPIWVDNWELYHLGWGEVHCGTNTQRTPLASWWTEARHLLERP